MSGITDPIPARRPAATTAPRRGPLAALSFRDRMLLAFAGIAASLALLVAGGLILNARVAVAEEVRSSFAVALRYLASRKTEIEQAYFPDNYLANLGLEDGRTRHVRAIAIDGAGRVVPPRGPAVPRADEEAEPPDWFVALLAMPPLREEIPLVFKSGQTATIVLESEPHDEITEVWQDFRFIVPLLIGYSVLLTGLLTLVLNHLFGRIHRVTEGLDRLAGGRLDTRVEAPGIPELAAIAGRFNDLAGALAAREAENRDLARRLLTVQDDERKAIALDLHDELGPYLFGLRAAAAKLPRPGPDGADGLDGVDALIDLAQAIQARTRRIISTLRPMSLGEATLRELLDDLVAGLDRLSDRSDIALAARIPDVSYGEAADITVYRFVQESVLNAMRHGDAATVRVAVVDEGAVLAVTVTDDGSGPAAPAPKAGYGLAGIAERARALGGAWAAPRQSAGRTVTSIRLPIERRLAFTPDNTEIQH